MVTLTNETFDFDGSVACVCATVRKLCVSFGQRQVLYDIDLDFPSKKVSVLLGPSGSGKTTLLRSLNRLNECFDGYEGRGSLCVEADGVLTPVENLSLSQLRRLVGMVFQTPNPLPLSIRKNMMLPLTLVADLEKRAAEQVMEKTLIEVGLWSEVADRLDRPAMSLSGGQQQRLCLARALALEPEILLLDEPTSSLDRAAVERIEELILSLKGRYSIILVSHNLVQARKLGDFLAILSDGAVKKILDASELSTEMKMESF